MLPNEKNLFNFGGAMNTTIKMLSNCLLFRNIKEDCIAKILNTLEYTTNKYPKDNTVAIEEDECNHLGILLEGMLTIQTIFPSGKVLTLTHIYPSDIFGEVVLFSPTHKYPATITALKDSKVMFIGRKAFVWLMSEHPCIMENFISSLSNKLLLLNKKVKILSMDSIRQKICNFLFQEYRHQKSTTMKIPLSRKDMAEHLAIPRPSLSRELAKMKDEGIIDFEKNIFFIKNLDALEECTL